jgi:hypothetical protein
MAEERQWECLPHRQMQDNDPAERNAFQTLTEGTGTTLDCSVHLLREAKHRIRGRNRKDKKAEEGAFGVDFEQIKVLPDAHPMGAILLRKWCWELFEARWSQRQPDACHYILEKAAEGGMVFHRAQAGPGRNTDNNGEEGSNRWTKVANSWTRLSISSFVVACRGYLEVESATDFSEASRWHEFNRAVWNRKVGKYVVDAVQQKVMMMRFNVGKESILIPTGKALELLPEGVAPSEAKKALEGYRKTAALLFGKNPKKAIPGIKEHFSDDKSVIVLQDVIDWLKTFAFLKPANYSPGLTALLHDCLQVPEDKRSKCPLYRCHCKDYMHYLNCKHVVLFHVSNGDYWPGKMPKRLRPAEKIETVNGACKGHEGPGRKKTKITPGQALNMD